MIWVELLVSSAIVVLTAVKLAQYGDVISIRTKLGGMFVGTLVLAGATSLPELMTLISSYSQGVPNLSGGGVFGSSMFNMFLLAILDVMAGQTRLLRRIARKHAIAASFAILLTLVAVFSLLADVDLRIGWVGLDSVAIIVTYIVGVRLVRGDEPHVDAPGPEADLRGMPSLRHAIIGFAAAAGVLMLAMPLLVRSATAMAERLGLTLGFVGSTLVAIITSLPEFVTCVAAIRLGAYDMAVGNLFGSNMFNIFALGVVDVFYLKGRVFGALDPSFALVGVLGAILTGLGLIGNLVNVRRRLRWVEIDALAIILVYLGALWLLYSRRIGA